MTKRKARRNWSAGEKMRVVLAGMEPGIEVSEVCREQGVSPTQYYSWRNQFLSSAEAVFGKRGKKSQEGREAQLESELARMKRVVAEITAENLELKKRNALGLEDYGQLPSELQARVVAEMQQAKKRSDMPVRESLKSLGVPVTTYYRWLREAAWNRETARRAQPVQAFEALSEEKQAVEKYALDHPEIRHRELAWPMIDGDVAFLSPSTVYRILSDEDLMYRRPVRQKRYRQEEEKATHPDHIWGTDFMYLTAGEHQFFLITFIDEYSRYLVHWEVMSRMDGLSISQAAQAALETLPRDADGKTTIQPIVRSGNGRGYISREFGDVLEYHHVAHHRIRPHCAEEHGITERANRTLSEYMDEIDINTKQRAEEELQKIIDRYNHERSHSSLGFKPPAVYYRGNLEAIDEQRAISCATPTIAARKPICESISERRPCNRPTTNFDPEVRHCRMTQITILSLGSLDARIPTRL